LRQRLGDRTEQQDAFAIRRLSLVQQEGLVAVDGAVLRHGYGEPGDVVSVHLGRFGSHGRRDFPRTDDERPGWAFHENEDDVGFLSAVPSPAAWHAAGTILVVAAIAPVTKPADLTNSLRLMFFLCSSPPCL
jgi:hypothetical protein